ncbi:Ribose-5-phosphate isomerase [Yarrowia sp. C11]|nr:Ribose-5-phosphate isomerase [Yarrowia sp. E02]KAG5373053.1 Ribose-5-phosphate isomerase [Yarrowia sp. C11]
MSSELPPLEQAKRIAAHQAVEQHYPKDAKVVGIGSGSTVVYVAEKIASMPKELTKDTVFISTGFQSKQLIQNAGLRLGCIDQYSAGDLDVAFDGADETDPQLNCIKGGGACLFQEKIVAECARKFVIVADYRKQSKALGTVWIQGIPIEVVPDAYNKVIADLKKMGAQSAVLRPGSPGKAGPIITDNGNFIVDAYFGEIKPEDVKELHIKIKLLLGVVETGLFTNADVAYFGNADGTVSTVSK